MTTKDEKMLNSMGISAQAKSVCRMCDASEHQAYLLRRERDKSLARVVEANHESRIAKLDVVTERARVKVWREAACLMAFGWLLTAIWMYFQVEAIREAVNALGGHL